MKLKTALRALSVASAAKQTWLIRYEREVGDDNITTSNNANARRWQRLDRQEDRFYYYISDRLAAQDMPASEVVR